MTRSGTRLLTADPCPVVQEERAESTEVDKALRDAAERMLPDEEADAIGSSLE